MNYEDLFRRVLESVVGVQPHSWSAAQALAAELEGYSSSQQDALLQSPRFRGNYLLVRALCSRALDARFSEPDRTLALADLAVRAALWLYESRPQPLAVDDLSESLATFGNATRMYGQVAEAEVCLSLAEWFSRSGTGDPEVEALILRFRASVEAEREDWAASLDKALRAAELYRGLSCPDRLGQCLISAGRACLHLGNPQSAVPYLSVGLWQIREDSNPTLALGAIHLLACAAYEEGRFEAALATLEEAVPLRELLAGSLVDVRMSWFEGYIHARRGEQEVAIDLLATAREGMLRHELPYGAAWVTMDLATIYLETGDAESALSLLPATIPVFDELGAQKKLQKAIKLLEGSVQLSVAKAALLELQEILARRSKRRFLP